MNEIAKKVLKEAYAKYSTGSNRYLAMFNQGDAEKQSLVEALNYLTDSGLISVLAKSSRFWECKLTTAGVAMVKGFAD